MEAPPPLLLQAGSGTTSPRSTSSLLRRHWFPALALVAGVYAGLPWLAPAMMRLGWTQPANLIYGFYSTQCHQLANRSYFLFGPKWMYSPAELQDAGAPEGFLSLRTFRGAPQIGWKMAWSDRMTAMYTGLFVFGVVLGVNRRRLKPLPTWAFIVLLLPLALDGTSHLISDFGGMGQGFRDSNLWLAALAAGRFGPGFYQGDAWGSFNAWMRLLTGLLFGLGVAWYSISHLSQALDRQPEA